MPANKDSNRKMKYHVKLPDGTVWPMPYNDENWTEQQYRNHVNSVLSAYWHIVAHPCGTESVIQQLRMLRKAVRAEEKA
jgi:hypothetical protein